MYEHEGKLLVRDIDGVLHEAELTVVETGGCKVTLKETTYVKRPKGATPVTADTLVRRYHLVAGQKYPATKSATATKPTVKTPVKSPATSSKATKI